MCERCFKIAKTRALFGQHIDASPALIFSEKNTFFANENL